ncbi:GNAT family N-acetyltransferase [Cytobacillus depressus]|uniref:GNAT family N-acetyltransferase n=1 Tax=Cytobacillus depressus TaxID=1602942 RepID=A0A6L3UXF7_9BACI|nr:GNAT family N-acetyltransferase [Cytobacillus depressus]KAB2328626.1 GNAT family N-acetyltransferase [Cytobacillus depressus]
MIEIKRLVDCTLQEGVDAWNIGFKGYYFDATTTPETFINRLVHEGLSPCLSIVAFQDNQPVGIVKNGVREFKGKRIAWNGGTGVAKALRGKGIGKLLMEETLSILKNEKVDIATLEAISDNHQAIQLYKKMGYEIIDDLEYLSLDGQIEKNAPTHTEHKYKLENAAPQEVAELSFYKGMYPWQTQWQNAKGGEAIILKNSSDAAIGYAYFRRVFNEENKHVTTVLYQCEAEDKNESADKIIKLLLHVVFSRYSNNIHYVVPNLPIRKSSITYESLKEAGFKRKTSQVYMIKQM